MSDITPRVRWTWWRLFWYSVLVGLIYVSAQILAIIGLGAVHKIVRPDFNLDAWIASVDSNGFALSVATLGTALVSLPVVRVLAGRVSTDPWAFLGIRAASSRQILLGCAAIAAYIAVSDLLSLSMGRPLVPPFMTEAYKTAGSPILLILVLIVVAPVLEELLFRGFLYGGLQACGAPVAAGVLVSSALFAILHGQYDAHDITVVFGMGVLFGLARARFGSTVPSIAMHSFANAVAFTETVLVAS